MTELDTIVCSDALALMDGLPAQSVDAIVTDPPYGIGNVVSAWRLPQDRFDDVANNQTPYLDWLPRCIPVLKPGSAAYFFASWRNLGVWVDAIQSAGLIVRDCIVWDKVIHGLSGLTTHYAPRHEFIIYAVKQYHYLRGPRPSNVLVYSRVNAMDLTHPYEKPIDLIERILQASTDPAAIVLDPFCGSGTTAIAARNTGRHFICGDISAEYVAIARKRLRDSDPFQSSEVADGVTQLSLFGE